MFLDAQEKKACVLFDKHSNNDYYYLKVFNRRANTEQTPYELDRDRVHVRYAHVA